MYVKEGVGVGAAVGMIGIEIGNVNGLCLLAMKDGKDGNDGNRGMALLVLLKQRQNVH